jgi:hypothetical protein
MNPSVISALSALIGAGIGGLATFLASWITQRMQMPTQWLVQERLQRQDLYKEFIELASTCYTDALQHEQGDVPSLVMLYSKIGRMRILSQPKIIVAAEEVAHKILSTYSNPNRDFYELREMVDKSSVDILNDFTNACREEFELLRKYQL